MVKLFHQASYAKPDCPRCHGTGAWPYNHDHTRPCPLCCKHDLGFWKLTPAYEGYKSGGRWCCRAGCGLAFPFNPDTWVPPKVKKVVVPVDQDDIRELPPRNPWAWSPGPQRG